MTERICGIDPDLSFGVTVSIDGFREYHDFVRRLPGLYDRAVGTLTSLLALAKRTPNLTVGVTTVFMRDNQKDFESFCDYVYETFRPHQHSINLIRGEAYDPTLKESLDVDLYERISAKQDSRYPIEEIRGGWRGVRTRARREINRLRYEYIARQAKGAPFEQFCLAGEREYVLSEDGFVYGCELIGQSLTATWELATTLKIRGEKARASSTTNEASHLCKCTHECNTRTLSSSTRHATPCPALALRTRAPAQHQNRPAARLVFQTESGTRPGSPSLRVVAPRTSVMSDLI